MNKQDEKELIDAWHSDTNYLNEKIDEHFRLAQNHAYALGRTRGQVSSNMTDDKILEISAPFGEFQFGDAQGKKRIEFARAILSAARLP